MVKRQGGLPIDSSTGLHPPNDRDRIWAADQSQPRDDPAQPIRREGWPAQNPCLFLCTLYAIPIHTPFHRTYLPKTSTQFIILHCCRRRQAKKRTCDRRLLSNTIRKHLLHQSSSITIITNALLPTKGLEEIFNRNFCCSAPLMWLCFFRFCHLILPWKLSVIQGSNTEKKLLLFWILSKLPLKMR